MKNSEKDIIIEKIERDIRFLEEGVEIMDSDLLIQKTRLDLLAINNLGKLVIIEISKEEDDTLIFRGLDHYDWVLNNMDTLQKKYSSYDIDVTSAPEVVLIAKDFSENFLRRLSYLNRAKINLYKYNLEEDTQNMISFKSVKFEHKKTDYDKNLTPEQIINGIKDKEVRRKCFECFNYIKNLKENIKLDTTKGVLQFEDENGYLGGIYPEGNFFWINLNTDYWSGKKINRTTVLDFNKIIR